MTKDRLVNNIILYSILSQGVQILRVHDVKEINQAFKVFKKLQN